MKNSAEVRECLANIGEIGTLKNDQYSQSRKEGILGCFRQGDRQNPTPTPGEKIMSFLSCCWGVSS